MKFLRNTAGYKMIDHKRNNDSREEYFLTK